MVVTISSSKQIHRYDSSTKPVMTMTGLNASAALNRFVAEDQIYKVTIGTGFSPYTWNPLNRTQLVNAMIRRHVFSTYVLTDVSVTVGTDALQFFKAPATGDDFDGAVFADVVSGNCGLEIKPTGSINYTQGVFLQSGTPSFDQTSNAVEHALIFGQGGAGSIWEVGVNKSSFTWALGDRGFIELKNGFVKYWQIKSETDVRLLRTVRSALAYPVKPTFLLYHQNATADVTVFLADEAFTPVQIYGVLNWDLQDLENSQTLESLAEGVVSKDKKEDFTYFSRERNLINMGINLQWRLVDLYQEFREFYQWHDKSREFIFVDKARAKLLLTPSPGLAANEMFARFTGPWKDNPLGADMYGASVDLRQMINPPTLAAIF